MTNLGKHKEITFLPEEITFLPKVFRPGHTVIQYTKINKMKLKYIHPVKYIKIKYTENPPL